jgi:hypothetical protein
MQANRGTGPHLQPAVLVGMPVEAAAAKRTGPLPECKVCAVLLAHGCLVSRHYGLFVGWRVGPLCAWGDEVGWGAADGAGTQSLHQAATTLGTSSGCCNIT